MDEEAYGRGKFESLCAFCRTPAFTLKKDETDCIKKMAESGNAIANYNIGMYYKEGLFGFSLDLTKTNEFLLKAGELGCAVAYHNLGNAFDDGRGVEMDKKKAKHYWELAAMNGSLLSRYNLGCVEGKAGNFHRSCKHFLLSARAGHKESLDAVKEGYMMGHVTKEEYANTLRAYQTIQNEIKSDDRDRAKAFYRAVYK